MLPIFFGGGIYIYIYIEFYEERKEKIVEKRREVERKIIKSEEILEK